MDYDSYQAFVVSMASPQSDLATAAIGLCDEVAEVFSATSDGAASHKELLKEFGDTLWYTTYAAHHLGTSLAILLDECAATDDFYEDRCALVSSIPYFRESLVIRAGAVAGAVKKVLYHGHSAKDEHVAWKLHLVLETILHLTEAYGFTLHEIIDANVLKLRSRYGEKFSEERSIRREAGV
ncbi:MAG TPA: hypothetical protein VGN15_08695 [Ktedonobacteraceae bacterium]|nr:hypothetical protein [Ktedonobacteraceae bacterium]